MTRTHRLFPAALPLCFTAAMSLCFTAALARADTIYSGSLPRQNVTITGIKDGLMSFDINGRSESLDLSKVTRIEVLNETPLNTAETAFAAGKFDDAVDGYQKTVRSTPKPWLKDWATQRLIASANKSGRFDAAVSAYVASIMKDPAAAASVKPTLPADPKSTFIDTAIKTVNDAIAPGIKLSDDQRIALLTFLIDLQGAKQDKAAVDSTSDKLDEILSKNPENPMAAKSSARKKLQAAQQALDAKDYDKAGSTIEQSKALFTDPQQQADALWILAEAKFGPAGASKDKTALLNAGLAYMRIVTFCKDTPGKTHVADALLNVAQIHELIGDNTTALKTYQEVAGQFGSDPQGAKAKENIDRLRQAGVK